MMYLSKGMAVRPGAGRPFCVSRCGKSYALGPVAAELWRRGNGAPAPVPEAAGAFVQKMAEAGLAVMTGETGPLASFRLLAGCILSPAGGKWALPLLGSRERRIWAWLTQSGLRLTSSELIRLEEQNIQPEPSLLGELNRQELTEKIYSGATIFDGVLEAEMERSLARDATVASILRLLRARRLLLI
jgi:hypothetical protein